MSLLTGGNIANVERIQIETEETTPRTFVFETANSCNFNAQVSSGQEVEQRVKNTLMGLLKTDDLVKGYDLELEDQRLIAPVLALLDGGTLTGTGDEWTKYEAPAVGNAPERVAFTLTMYTSDRDTDGEAKAYYAWKFPTCKGTPVSGSAQDGSFTNMRYTIKSRPAMGVKPMEITKVTTLPAVTSGNG